MILEWLWSSGNHGMDLDFLVQYWLMNETPVAWILLGVGIILC